MMLNEGERPHVMLRGSGVCTMDAWAWNEPELWPSRITRLCGWAITNCNTPDGMVVLSMLLNMSVVPFGEYLA